MIEYEEEVHLSPCKKTEKAKVQEFGLDSNEKWRKISKYECGCKVFENFYGSREELCNETLGR